MAFDRGHERLNLNLTKHQRSAPIVLISPPGRAFFEKQIPWACASTLMQIGPARVFSITCGDLHSWFVWVRRVSTSGREGQDRLSWKYLRWCFLRFTVWHDPWIISAPKGAEKSSTYSSWSCDSVMLVSVTSGTSLSRDYVISWEKCTVLQFLLYLIISVKD